MVLHLSRIRVGISEVILTAIKESRGGFEGSALEVGIGDEERERDC